MTGQPHTFTVILEPAEEGGFVVTVPALPELGTQGDTFDEAMANAREAIELVIEDRLARGEPIPRSWVSAGTTAKMIRKQRTARNPTWVRQCAEDVGLRADRYSRTTRSRCPR